MGEMGHATMPGQQYKGKATLRDRSKTIRGAVLGVLTLASGDECEARRSKSF